MPYGGGSSVVGGVTVRPSERPVVTVDLTATAGLLHLDETSGLATFGAGTLGPALEAALAPHGLTLGHYPQSFEGSTVGGWVVTRSVGQQAHGFGRIDDLFAGGRLETPRGPLDLPPHPASAAGPDLREIVLGSEGRLGILTEVTVRASRVPRLERFNGYVVPDWDRALELARRLGQSGLPLSMARVSTPLETATTFALAGDRRGSGLLRRYLDWRGQGRDRCLVIVGLTGQPEVVGATARAVDDLVRGSHGVAAPGDRARLAPVALRGALPAQRPVGRGLRRRHARDGDRLDDAARRSPPSSRGRFATDWRPRASASTPSATCRTRTPRVPACTRATSSAWRMIRTRRSNAGAR